MNKHIAARTGNGQWQVVRIIPSDGKSDRRGCLKTKAVRKVIESGLTMDEAIARAAELNGSRQMHERHPVRPRCRVGVRTA